MVVVNNQWTQTDCLFIGGSEGRLMAARDEGADEVLTRGFPIEDLSAAIERIIHLGK